MSLPLCLAAKLLSIKIYLIEPNMVLGRANKLLLKFSKIIICYSKNIINFPKKFENKLRILKPLVRKKYYEELTNIEEKGLFTITRGGASSLAELSLLKVPFISIPLPSAMDNHQYENAKFYEAQNTCWIINQKDFEKQNFEDLLLNIIKNKEEYLVKKKNLENLNYQNTWNNVNQNLLSILNEN